MQCKLVVINTYDINMEYMKYLIVWIIKEEYLF